MNNDNKKVIKNLALYLGIPILIFLIIYFVLNQAPKQETSKYSDILNYFETDQVTEYVLDFGTGEMLLSIKGEGETKTEVYYEVPNISLFYEDVRDDIERYNKQNPDAKMVQDIRPAAQTSWLLSMLPMLVLF